MEEYILLGKILKLHGISGEVAVSTDKPLSKAFSKPDFVFLEIEGKKVPFCVETCELQNNKTLFLKFEGYGSAGKVKEFTGCNVYVKVTGSRKEKKVFYWDELLNYRIISEGSGISGNIIAVIDNPGNLLLKVKDENSRSELFIPFHEDLIVAINKKQKIIYMNLPEGLSDINK
ncbi:MAG: ribosome maturation factor RimM [Bacteroidales bacterium]